MILLRKLALKSPLTGLVQKYGGNTVEWVLANHPATLVSIYYSKEKITFLPEIIEVLKVQYPNFYEIDKPGIDKDFYDKVFPSKGVNYSKMSYNELVTKMRGFMINRGEAPSTLLNAWNKAKLLVIEQRDIKRGSVISKAELQGINQGRKSHGNRID